MLEAGGVQHVKTAPLVSLGLYEVHPGIPLVYIGQSPQPIFKEILFQCLRNWVFSSLCVVSSDF